MGADMMYTAIAGLNTFNDALSVVSDNIANANTTGFKSNSVDFGDLVSGLMATGGANTTAAGAGSCVLGITPDWSTGAAIQTGTWSDLMIQGNGFFIVQDTSSGADYYTRDGSFQINSSGNLTDSQGNSVLGTTGKPISMWNTATPPGPYASYSIDQFGNITGTDSSGNINPIGQLQVATFNNPSGLVRVGQNMYTPGSSAGAPILGKAGSGQAGQLISGALEGSNVDLTTQMVNLITYQADYQANSKSVETGNTLMQTMVNLIR